MDGSQQSNCYHCQICSKTGILESCGGAVTHCGRQTSGCATCDRFCKAKIKVICSTQNSHRWVLSMNIGLPFISLYLPIVLQLVFNDTIFFAWSTYVFVFIWHISGFLSRFGMINDSSFCFKFAAAKQHKK